MQTFTIRNLRIRWLKSCHVENLPAHGDSQLKDTVAEGLPSGRDMYLSKNNKTIFKFTAPMDFLYFRRKYVSIWERGSLRTPGSKLGLRKKKEL